MVKKRFRLSGLGSGDGYIMKCFQNLVTLVLLLRKLRLSIGNVKDSVFLFASFSNWKDVTIAFGSNEKQALK